MDDIQKGIAAHQQAIRSNIAKSFIGSDEDLEKGGVGSGPHKVGSIVKVHPQLTSDPNKRQGQTGKVIDSNEHRTRVEFEDGKKGDYSHDALLKQKDKVQKSEEDDLEKGHGEGSRGGKVIGHTKSGKPVYEGHFKIKKQIGEAYDKLVGSDNEHRFWSTLLKHGYEPNDDGESESTMLENISKHPKAVEIIADLKKHMK